jgi:hypothetical protein
MKIFGFRLAPPLVCHAAWIGILLIGATAWAGASPPQPKPGQSTSSSHVIASRTAPRVGDSVQRGLDACALLSGATIKRVQSETLQGRKRTRAKSGSLIVSQCFYSLPTFANSISVTLALPDPAGPSRSGARDLWDSLFHRAVEFDARRDGQGKEPSKETSSKDREENAPPLEIHGLGDEAYWISSFCGALYVLKGNAFLRISVGGKLDDAVRLNKSQQLARDALQRLP